jgi:hypothetical protein
MGIGGTAATHRAYLKRLAGADVAGLGFGLGFGHDKVPRALVAEAARRGFPVFEVPYPVPFIAITEAVFTRLLAEQYDVLQRAVDAQHVLTAAVLEGEGVEGIAATMVPEDRIILCTAEPHWIYDKLLKRYDNQINENNLAFLEEKIFCRKIAVFLSGDLHHYRRHATDDNRHKITAGGGGGFLHPTHGGDVSELRNHYRFKTAFPPPNKSKSLTWRNLGFLYFNPLFGCTTSLLYTLTCWSVMANIGRLGIGQWSEALKRVIGTSIGNPTAVFWILLVWGGFLLFTDTYSKWYRWIAGTLHGLAHVLAMFFIGWFASYVGMTWLDWHFKSPKQLVLAGAIIAVVGWIAGSIVMGVYLVVSLNFFKRHANEAFSALAIPDWKSFLRLKIDGSGGLTIFPIGIRRVPRKWKASEQTGGSIFVPDDPKATDPELIEQPIVIPW